MLLHRLPVAFEADHELVVLSLGFEIRFTARNSSKTISSSEYIIFSSLPTYGKLEITTSYIVHIVRAS